MVFCATRFQRTRKSMKMTDGGGSTYEGTPNNRTPPSHSRKRTTKLSNRRCARKNLRRCTANVRAFLGAAGQMLMVLSVKEPGTHPQSPDSASRAPMQVLSQGPDAVNEKEARRHLPSDPS